MSKPKKYSERISDFLDLMNEVKSAYEINLENQRNEEALTQDLLHKLELEDTPYKERCKIATQLKINRQDRRYYKDVVEEIEPLYNFLYGNIEGTNANKKFVERLKQVLGAVKKQEKYHTYRTYVPKVLKQNGEAN